MRTLTLVLFAALLAACGDTGASAGTESPSAPAPADTASAATGCDPSATQISLPPGFCATVFASGLGTVRHIAVDQDGDVYAILRAPVQGHGLVALRDTDGDGAADVVKRFGQIHGSGITIADGWLYAATNTDVYRWRLPEDGLVPRGERQLVVGGFPVQHQHAPKTIAVNEAGTLFVNVGAPSNACQKQDRTRGSPGMDPCPLLKRHGGIWRFSATAAGQRFSADRRFATGIRNAVAIAWNSQVNELYVVQHGRDQLHFLFPDLYTIRESAKLPAEQMYLVNEGDNFGWPYCYYNWMTDRKLLMPEYGGNGEKVGRCDKFEEPIIAFPGHWAPNGLVFYSAEQFPERYRGGAFVAFHGSWNRAPLPQAGYKVVFVPFEGNHPAGGYEVFADGFSGQKKLAAPGSADYRPMGLAVGPKGALFIGDTQQGRIWKIRYVGEE